MRCVAPQAASLGQRHLESVLCHKAVRAALWLRQKSVQKAHNHEVFVLDTQASCSHQRAVLLCLVPFGGFARHKEGLLLPTL